MSRVPQSVRRAVYERDGFRCVHCGATGGLSLQHRKNRGMGGSRLLDTPANLVVLCLLENQALEADTRKANIARFYGWKLKPWDDPLAVQVYDVNLDEWFLLDDKGGRRPAKPVEPVTDDFVPF